MIATNWVANPWSIQGPSIMELNVIIITAVGEIEYKNRLCNAQSFF